MLSIIFYYFRWHYSHGVVDFVGIIRNFLWFFYEFFSIPLLLKTFFVPFGRLEDDKKPTSVIDFGAMAENILVSMLMRIVGMLLRTLLVVLGIAFITFTLVVGIVGTVVWLVAPALLAFLFVAGGTLLAIG